MAKRVTEKAMRDARIATDRAFDKVISRARVFAVCESDYEDAMLAHRNRTSELIALRCAYAVQRAAAAAENAKASQPKPKK